MLGNEPVMHPDYPRIINQKHFNRLMELIKDEAVLEGGYANQDTMQIAPTILDHITWESPVMQQEIFGPILPILTFCNIPEAISRVKAKDKPLALYLFTRDPAMEHRVLKELSFGADVSTIRSFTWPHPRWDSEGSAQAVWEATMERHLLRHSATGRV